MLYLTIGGSRGGLAHAPLRVKILSFRHTKFSKRNCLGSQRPHLDEVNAPYGKSWIPHWISFSYQRILGNSWFVIYSNLPIGPIVPLNMGLWWIGLPVVITPIGWKEFATIFWSVMSIITFVQIGHSWKDTPWTLQAIIHIKSIRSAQANQMSCCENWTSK